MNKESNKKFFKLILVIAIIALLIWVISNTYSKFINKISNNSPINIANWNIKINDQNITEEDDFTDVIEFELDESEHIEEDVIVPTSSGSFDIELDSTGTDLPFEYEFSIAEDIDASSTFTGDVVGTPSGNDTDGYTYQLHFLVDYEFLGRPVAYTFRYADPSYAQNELGLNWEEGVAFGNVFNGINLVGNYAYDTDTYGTDQVTLPIILELPSGMEVLSVEGSPAYTYNASSHKVTFQTKPIDWYRSDNSNKTTETITAPWDPNIKITERCTTNTLEYTLNVKYTPPTGQTGLPVSHINSVFVGGRVITQKTLNDFKITRYKLNNNAIHTLAPGETKVEGRVDPSLNQDGTNTGNEVKNNFTFWVEWYDGNDNVLNNFEDVKASKMTTPTGVITVKAKITQVLD